MRAAEAAILLPFSSKALTTSMPSWHAGRRRGMRLEMSTNALDSPAAPPSTLGFSFSPGGLLFHWPLGVAKALQDQQLLTPLTPIAGASAGALACAVLGCGIDVDAAVRAADRLCLDCRENGTRGRLRGLLADLLDDILPEDAHERLTRRPGVVGVAVTPLLPWPRGVVVDSFSSRADVLECLVASCAVPLWFSGGLAVRCRNAPTVDGFFASPWRHFGAPQLPAAAAAATVRVSAFPAGLVGLAPEPLPWGEDAEEEGVEGEKGAAARDKGSVGVICPRPRGEDGAAHLSALLEMALNPGDPTALEALYDDGYRTGAEWAKRHGHRLVKLGQARIAAATIEENAAVKEAIGDEASPPQEFEARRFVW
ncbi:unnamed protein product [Phaeothamnion confervicola]